MYQTSIESAKLFHKITQLDVQLISLNGQVAYQSTAASSSEFQFSPNIDQVQSILKAHSANFYLHYDDATQLDYLAIGMFEKAHLTGLCLVGPFIAKTMTVNMVSQLLLKTSLTASEQRQLTQFYNALPLLDAENVAATGQLLVTLFSRPVAHPQSQRLHHHDQPLQAQTVTAINDQTQAAIDRRYQLEAKMMQLVSTGDLTNLAHFQRTMPKLVSLFSNRIPNQPLRSGKNICFVNNTVCRIAAGRGGVHPVFLDSLSEKYAILIEKQQTLQGLENLVSAMLHEYTQLVADVAISGVSPLIKRTIDFILIHLGHFISLTATAHFLHTNPAYLARQFKSETGRTFTQFVNQRRIALAKTYLMNPQLSITEIAGLLGYNDLTYFARVFKQQTGETPHQYRKRNPHHLLP
ncbi:helix-turn-helix transcriptional regulator [Lentilactobacillus raoultii]|uniref:Helix-turn-helix transcriptional regulator n=1 Tax=Lentilactobacillus raoultii TaxID=1987503 RepID=A0ABW3PT05_9LACO|nr:AraC family transcriptional regulator [Lentilactobacillus raoultii]